MQQRVMDWGGGGHYRTRSISAFFCVAFESFAVCCFRHGNDPHAQRDRNSGAEGAGNFSGAKLRALERERQKYAKMWFAHFTEMRTCFRPQRHAQVPKRVVGRVMDGREDVPKAISTCILVGGHPCRPDVHSPPGPSPLILITVLPISCPSRCILNLSNGYCPPVRCHSAQPRRNPSGECDEAELQLWGPLLLLARGHVSGGPILCGELHNRFCGARWPLIPQECRDTDRVFSEAQTYRRHFLFGAAPA